MKKYPHGLTLNAVCDAIDAYREQEDDIPEAGMIAAFEILLSAMDKPETALAAQTVKVLDCDFGAVSHMSGGSKDYCNGFVDGTQNAIKAIRAAGYEVQE